ncbi:MAG: toprim domain-containing protein [Roseococcus sp.]|nr:toprim domain-containing protein [Roseococcus sp.]
MTSAPGAADLAAMLGAEAEGLAAQLLPAGRRDGPHWRCGSLAGEPGQSLAVNLRPPHAGNWRDFATGEHGDALDLVAAVLFRGDLAAAMAWARQRLGYGSGGAAPPPRPMRRVPEPTDAARSADDAARARKALALFLSAAQSIAGTPVAHYLTARGIDLAELGRQPRALRFHPECWSMEAGGPLPAMLAAITDGQGQHIATHRTWLQQDAAGHWRKASVTQPKKVLGSYGGGFIPLQRGASGKPLRSAPEGESIAIAEGIETALSVAVACPELRVIAAVALGNMGRVVLPEAVQRVILCADNDEGEAQRAQLQHAADTLAQQGRDVRIARAPTGKDFNDTLRAVPSPEAGA